MDILDDQRERALTEVGLARLADSAGRRIGPERLVVSAAVLIASEAESAGRPEDQHGGGHPYGHPRGSFSQPGIVAGFAEQLGRIERREIGAEAVVSALHRRPSGINDERGEAEKNHERLHPPQIPTCGLGEAAALKRDIDRGHAEPVG